MLPHNYLHVQYKPDGKWIHCKARQPLEPSRVLSGVRSSCEPPSVWILTMVDWSDGGHCNGQFLCSFYVLNTEQTALMCTTSRLLLVLSVVSAACPMRPMPSSSVSQAAMIICCHVQSKLKLLRVCKQNPIFACLPIHDMSLIFGKTSIDRQQ